MENKELASLIESIEIQLSLMKVSLDYHREILEEMSTKLDNKIFEQMVRKNGLE